MGSAHGKTEAIVSGHCLDPSDKSRGKVRVRRGKGSELENKRSADQVRKGVR